MSTPTAHRLQHQRQGGGLLTRFAVRRAGHFHHVVRCAGTASCRQLSTSTLHRHRLRRVRVHEGARTCSHGGERRGRGRIVKLVLLERTYVAARTSSAPPNGRARMRTSTMSVGPPAHLRIQRCGRTSTAHCDVERSCCGPAPQLFSLSYAEKLPATVVTFTNRNHQTSKTATAAVELPDAWLGTNKGLHGYHTYITTPSIRKWLSCC